MTTINDFELLNPLGRTYIKDDKFNFDLSLSGFEVLFFGTTLEGDFSVRISEENQYPFISVIIDENDISYKSKKTATHIEIRNGKITLISGLKNAQHRVRIYKVTEAMGTGIGLNNLSTDGNFIKCEMTPRKKVLVYGDSLTCGTGTLANHNEERYPTCDQSALFSYASIAASHLNADCSLVSAGGFPLYKSPYTDFSIVKDIPSFMNSATIMCNLDLDGLPKFNNENYLPDLVIINLGTNDRSYFDLIKDNRELFEREICAFREKYVGFVRDILKIHHSPNVVLMGSVHYMNYLVNEIKEVENCLNMKNIMFFDFEVDETMGKFVSHGHMNLQMNEIVGEKLANFIKENNLI